MLQFNTAAFTIATRVTSRFLWRINASLTTNAAVITSESKTAVKLNDQIKQMTSNVEHNNKQYLMFDKLKIKLCSDLNVEPLTTAKIKKAQSIHEILEIMKTPSISQNDIVHILKTISTWISNNKESNSSTKINKSSVQSQTEVNKKIFEKSLNNTEINISQYSNLSTSAMIKKVSKLAQAGDRNVKLLNYFFQNIIKYHELLSAGACSNLMFSMSTLNYSDERLLKKICKDFIKIKNISGDEINIGTIISILKSMAFVRYKNNQFLNQLCDEIIKSKIKYSKTQIVNILQSFATLGYYSEHVNEIIKKHVTNSAIEKFGYTAKLNLVWCFAVFKILQNEHAEFILDKKFLLNMQFLDLDENKRLSHQLKLLNINGYAQCALKNYSGPFLNNEVVPHIVNKRSKQKIAYVDALEVTLKNMLPSTSHFNMNINTNMGFLLDAEIYVDRKFNFITKDSKKENFFKIAILLVDYYDTCLGDTDYHGLIKLHSYLLECSNYEVLIVPYQYFGIEDRIERRISYLRNQLSQIFRKRIE